MIDYKVQAKMFQKQAQRARKEMHKAWEDAKKQLLNNNEKGAKILLGLVEVKKNEEQDYLKKAVIYEKMASLAKKAALGLYKKAALGSLVEGSGEDTHEGTSGAGEFSQEYEVAAGPTRKKSPQGSLLEGSGEDTHEDTSGAGEFSHEYEGAAGPTGTKSPEELMIDYKVQAKMFQKQAQKARKEMHKAWEDAKKQLLNNNEEGAKILLGLVEVKKNEEQDYLKKAVIYENMASLAKKE